MNRFSFLDVFKGFGIFFVILGHVPIDSHLFSYIFSFQLAIFYFVGGFLYRYAHVVSSFPEYLFKKFKRIILPYIFWSIVSAYIYVIYSIYIGRDYNIFDIITSIIVSKRNHIYINVSLWFLTSFFTVEIIYYILKCFFNNYIIGIIVIIFGYIGVIVFRTTGSLNTLPFTFDASLYFIIYYFIGDLFSCLYKHLNREYKYLFRNLSPLFIICIVINVLNLLGKIKHADIIYYDFGFLIASVSYLFHIFISLTGVFAYLYLSYLLRWIGILRYIGRNSIYYFALHMPIYYILSNENFLAYFFDLDYIGSIDLSLIGLLYTVILIVIITLISLVINLLKFIIYRIKTSI